ncbi:MAG: hypothetical protein AAF632_09580 [Bacteroidota bacterium]
MNTFYALFALLFFTASTLSAQTILWDKTYGGTDFDSGNSIVATPDGGYLLGGTSESDAGFEKSHNIKSGSYDIWLVKVDAQGNKQWDKSYSGTGGDYLRTMLPTSDGNYLLGGTADESSIGFDKSEASRGGNDYWLIKVDAQGNKLWDKTIGGPDDDSLGDVVETSDGGFLVGGTSKGLSIGGEKTQSNHTSNSDKFWIVKIDANSNKLWDKVYGGEGVDFLSKIVKTQDGNYLLAGYSNSSTGFEKSEGAKGGPIGPNGTNSDYWIIKIDPNGNPLWDKTIGGNGVDRLRSAVLTADGGFLLGGHSLSDAGFDKSENRRGYWLVKTDAQGNVQWDKIYGGGGGGSGLTDLLMTSDQHLIIVGYSDGEVGYEKSEASKANHKFGSDDYWILKTDLLGNIIWDKTIGGSEGDYAWDAVLNSQGDLMILGNSRSPSGFDKTDFNRGGPDYWLVKLNTSKKVDIIFRDFVAICKFCWIWEIWWDYEYRFWNERLGVEAAIYRRAFEGRHYDEVFWEDEETLMVRLNEEGFEPGSYQFQIRALLEDGSTTEWTEPVGFTVGGATTEVFPNPVSEVLNIHYYGQVESETVHLLLYNRFGELLLEDGSEAYEGVNEWQLEMPWVSTEENPLTLQIISETQGEQSWQLIRE